jgi:hypothetical protein
MAKQRRHMAQLVRTAQRQSSPQVLEHLLQTLAP